MDLMVVVLTVLIACGIGYLVYTSSQPDWSEPTEPPPTEAELLQARLDLHKVERGTDLALAKQEIRREAERTKQAIAEALDGEG
jgi:hypothetical protein